MSPESQAWERGVGAHSTLYGTKEKEEAWDATRAVS